MSCNSLVNTTIYKNHKRILILFLKLLVVHQEFETDVFKSSVIMSNDILLQCVFPSHVSDLLEVSSWADSEGNTFTPDNSYGNPREPEICLHILYKDILRTFFHLHLDIGEADEYFGLLGLQCNE